MTRNLRTTSARSAHQPLTEGTIGIVIWKSSTKSPDPSLPPLFLEKSVPKNPAKNPEDGIIYTTPDPPINVLIDDKTIATDNKRVNSDTNPPELRKIKKVKRIHTLDEDSEKQLVIDEDLPSPELPQQKDMDAEDPTAVDDQS